MMSAPSEIIQRNYSAPFIYQFCGLLVCQLNRKMSECLRTYGPQIIRVPSYKLRIEHDQWFPATSCKISTNVPSLSQQHPAAPSSGQRRALVLSGGHQQPAATLVKTQAITRVKNRVKTRVKNRVKTLVKTRMAHLEAPCSTKCPFKTNSSAFNVCLKKILV